MAPINQIVTKGIDLVTKCADDAMQVISSSNTVGNKINSAFTASKLECKKAIRLMQRVSKANAEKMITVLKSSKIEIPENFDLLFSALSKKLRQIKCNIRLTLALCYDKIKLHKYKETPI